uniref:MH2 domain-containing protein n=1 Tax=Caenorhabditis tropicalis TaxID=1561998 RepID=A0A1I7UNE6_9PELO
MCPDGSGPREEEDYKEYTESANKEDWLSDAPMPDGEDMCYSSTNGSTQSNRPSSNKGATNPRTPFTPQNSGRHSEINPATPNQADISNMARLNLNSSSNLRMSINQKQSVNYAPKGPIDEEEDTIIEIYARPNERVQQEVLDQSEKRPWCTVNYCEMLKRLGTFIPQGFSFTVDNSTGDTEDHFGLASHGTEGSKASTCRNQLGNGIKITRDNEGAVWVTVLTGCPIFVLSPFRNMLANDPPETVCRLQNKGTTDENNQLVHEEFATIKVFDNKIYISEMNRIFHEEGIDRCADVVLPFCNVRISFSKGFGGNYNKKKISDTPSWIDVFLMGPMEDYDKIARQSSISNGCGSRS